MKASFQEALREIKNRVDILSVISKHLNVKKAGSSFVSLCPFHNDKSPSMHISPSKGIFKCFSCGASGDLFKFLVDYKKSSFSEVVHELAEEIGIEIVKRENKPEISKEYELIYKMNELAAKFFHQQLYESEEGKPALQYLLENRKLTHQTIKEFKLGYSPNKKTALLSFIQSEIKDEEIKSPEFLINSGLFILNKQTELPSDRFKGRLMIPIWDSDNKTIAFGARTLNPNLQPKYLNSPETPIYHKSRHLYGFNKAKENTRRCKKVLLLEGYFDVIQAHQNSIDYAVGSLGTALTKEQTSLLYSSTHNRKIILGFDNDEAGKRALKSSLHIFQEGSFSQKLDLRVLQIPNAKDIDEYLQTNQENQNIIDNTIESSPEVYSHLIESITKGINLQDSNKRSEALNEIVDLIFDINDPIDKEMLAEQCARALSFNKNTVMQLLSKKQRSKVTSKPSVPTPINLRNKFKKGKKEIRPILKLVANDTERTLVSILLLTDQNDIIERIESVDLKDESASFSREYLLKMNFEERQNLLEQDASLMGEQKKLENIIQLARWNKKLNHLDLLEDCLSKILGSHTFNNWEKNLKNKKANVDPNLQAT